MAGVAAMKAPSMLICVSKLADDSTSTLETLFFDVPEQLGQEILDFLESGVSEGSLWHALVETLVFLERLGMRRSGSAGPAAAVHELDPGRRKVLMAWCLRQQFQHREIPGDLPMRTECTLSLEWSDLESFSI